MRALQLLFAAGLLSLGTACSGLLGIDERALDTEELTEDGYDGCNPEDGECDDCTSSWHSCICEDWGSKPEAELRLDCADEAPDEIRADVEADAEEAYEEYLESVADDDDDDNDDGEADASAGEPEPQPNVEPEPQPNVEPEPQPNVEPEPQPNVEPEPQPNVEPAPQPNVEPGTVVEPTAEPEPVPVEPVPDPEPEPLPLFNDQMCSFSGPPPPCLGCFCGECRPEIDLCLDDQGCASIMNCSMEKGCNASIEMGPGSCFTDGTCRYVIDEFGGLLSGSYVRFRNAVKCRVDMGCPCGDPPPPIGCVPTDGCTDCIGCWDQCACDGNTTAVCRNDCGSPSCNATNGCDTCLDCVDACLCRGDGDIGFCIQQCYSTPPGGPECTYDQGCYCDSCFNECTCYGASADICEQECGERALDCADYDYCQGCVSCEGSCTCEGALDANECINQCGNELGCDAATGCSSCGSCQAACECGGTTPHDCLLECQGLSCAQSFGSECDRCACDTCPTEFALCEEVEGCPEFMECMNRTSCYNIPDCSLPETCATELNALGGIDSPHVGVVESLQSCRVWNDCPCFDATGPPPPVNCAGGTVCDPYVPPAPDPIAPACCGGPNSDMCGIDPWPVFGTNGAQACLTWGQPGLTSSDCPSLSPTQLPYDSATLLGCCRPEGICGYLDDVTGLGCLEPALFFVQNVETCTP